MLLESTVATTDPFHFTRFIKAQEGVYATAIAELRRGRKQTHWMWFIFPQIDGLGSSPTARYYAIKGMAEARAYLAHPVLGMRLIDSCSLALMRAGMSSTDIFGYPDDMKFRSSMTLFSVAVQDPASVFDQAIACFFGGAADQRTIELLKQL